MITYTNSLDFCPGGVPLFVRLSQYDSNFSLVFNCFSHKGDFTVENGSTAVFREHKPDGNVISIDATVSGTIVTLTPSATNAKQMTAIKGHCECEISLQKNGKELSSANFVLLVEKAPVDIDAVQSDSVVRELYDVADRAEEILEAAQTVDEAISDLPNLIDSTLTLPNHAADAKKTGDEISSLKSAIEQIEPGMSDDAKTALLACFAGVAWKDASGGDLYAALEAALYADTYPIIQVTYAGGSHIVYTDDYLDSIKPYLTVTYYETEESTGVVISAANYTLSGTLVEGQSDITVTYDRVRRTVAVPVLLSPVVGLNKAGSGQYTYNGIADYWCLVTPRDVRAVIVTRSNNPKCLTKPVTAGLDGLPDGVSEYSPRRIPAGALRAVYQFPSDGWSAVAVLRLDSISGRYVIASQVRIGPFTGGTDLVADISNFNTGDYYCVPFSNNAEQDGSLVQFRFEFE